MKDNVVVQWVVTGLSVVAFIVTLKLAATKMPETGVLGAAKTVIAGI